MLTNKDRLGIGILVGCAAVVAALLGTAAYLTRNRLEVDEVTLCPRELSPSRHVVIVVDKTDFMTPSQADAVAQLVHSAKESMTTHERLTLVMLDEDSDSHLDPLFSLCKPAQGKHANALYQNPKRIERNFEMAFGAPLTQKIEQLLAADEAPRSPLIETLNSIADWHDFVLYPARKITFVSDFLQHTPPAFSHYPDNNGGSPRKVPLGSLVSLDLEGVEVELIPLARGREALQDKVFVEWMSVVTAAGAQVANTRPGWLR